MTSANCYTVWNNKTDELVILDGTSKECAEAMGVTLDTFYSYLCKSKKGVIRWDITESKKLQRHKRMERVVKLRYYKGKSIKEIAKTLRTSKAIVMNDLKKHRRSYGIC